MVAVQDRMVSLMAFDYYTMKWAGERERSGLVKIGKSANQEIGSCSPKRPAPNKERDIDRSSGAQWGQCCHLPLMAHAHSGDETIPALERGDRKSGV